MIIQRIATLDLHVYADFCRWLRENGTTIGDLIKQGGVAQDHTLTKFLVYTGRIKGIESN